MASLTISKIRAAEQSPNNFWWPIYYFPSAYVVWIAARLKRTPNQITLTAFGINVLTTIIFIGSTTTPAAILVAYICFNIAHIFDFADGQLAFATGQRSDRGAWLDSSLDIFKIALVTVCYIKMIHMLAGVYGDIFVSFAALISVGNLINYTTSLAANSYRERIDPYQNGQSPLSKTLSDYGLQSRLAGTILSNLREYGNFLLIFAIFALSPSIGVVLLCIWGVLQWMFALNRVRSIFKQLG
jgi:phosphatidylglycerophosphate synthase